MHTYTDPILYHFIRQSIQNCSIWYNAVWPQTICYFRSHWNNCFAYDTFDHYQRIIQNTSIHSVTWSLNYNNESARHLWSSVYEKPATAAIVELKTWIWMSPSLSRILQPYISIAFYKCHFVLTCRSQKCIQEQQWFIYLLLAIYKINSSLFIANSKIMKTIVQATH